MYRWCMVTVQAVRSRGAVLWIYMVLAVRAVPSRRCRVFVVPGANGSECSVVGVMCWVYMVLTVRSVQSLVLCVGSTWY